MRSPSRRSVVSWPLLGIPRQGSHQHAYQIAPNLTRADHTTRGKEPSYSLVLGLSLRARRCIGTPAKLDANGLSLRGGSIAGRGWGWMRVVRFDRGHFWITFLAGVLLLTPAVTVSAAETTVRPVALHGQLAVVWADPQPAAGGTARTEALLIAADGRVRSIDLQRSTPQALAQLARLNGTPVLAEARVGQRGSLELQSLQPQPLASTGATRPPVRGHQQWANVLCRFSDMTDITPQPAEYVDNLMNGPEPSIADYWFDTSDGQIDTYGSTVWGWFDLPQPRSYYVTDTDFGPLIEYSRISEDCAGMADPFIDFNDYDGLNLLFNAELDGYARGGTFYYRFDGADRSFGTTWIPTWGYQTQYIMAHEMGHAFGLPHSSGPYDTPYDSMWDVMSLGGTCNPYHPQFGCIGADTIALHKVWLGWVPEERQFTFVAPQEATILLERLADPGPHGYLLARIPIQTSATHYYTVEVRRQVGYDRYVPGDAVLIHEVDEGRYDRPANVVDPDRNGNPNDDGAMWLPGETFRDARNDITIRVDSATATGFVVTIHAGDAFTRTWARTDRPIVEGVANRTWMWGPESFSGTIPETYFEASGSVRHVRYYDKSRMEITDVTGDPTETWYVTNGLLVVELTTGRMQMGDNLFDTRTPAQVNVAGDADDPLGPTYATFGALRNAPPLADGAPVVQRLARDGTVTTDPALAARGVTAAHRVQVPGIDHQVASPFWEFMHTSDVIWADGYGTAPLFPDPFYATGLPISEAYWAEVKVAGVYQDVLMQCFERRCLTYTPENPPGWQVEAGNVGQHYYAWRYAPVELEGALVFSSTRYGDSDIVLLRDGDTQPTPLTTSPAIDLTPDLSPDGRRIVFARVEGDVSNIWVMERDGSNQRQLTHGISAHEPVWSPDGTRIAFSGSVDHGLPDIWVMDADGSNLQVLTSNPYNDLNPDWSPDGARIVYSRDSLGGARLFIMDADGGNQQQLTYGGAWQIHPAWSPDGTTIVYAEANILSEIMGISVAGGQPWLIVSDGGYASEPDWSPDGDAIVYSSSSFGGTDVFIVSAEGGTPRNVTNSPANEAGPSWGRNVP
ncbi:MAG: hypothetical protein DCC58_09195 [Chloroflexi bacterium]|nr:MAG: hypothetical protein DCC58_09195 [Chloroflexota bacterium]